MSDLATPDVPAWVRKRDGRLEPFEPDKISRALFAATEELGRPDAFLSREMTDGVLHFLVGDTADPMPTAEHVADVVVKCVRELGHPQLALAFADHRQASKEPASPGEAAARPPARAPSTSEVVVRFSAAAPLQEVLTRCAESYTLQAVFARDLAAIHHDGLLSLGGLDRPGQLAACVFDWPADVEPGCLAAAVDRARDYCGGVLVLDGPDQSLAHAQEQGLAAVARLAQELIDGLRRAGLRAVVNLNCLTPPSSVLDLAGGPLFASQHQSPAPAALAALADLWLDVLAQISGPGALRIDWHLAAADFLPPAAARLRRLARLWFGGTPLAFVFDRARKPAALAEGIARPHPALLLHVGLHLPRLAEQTGATPDAERFVQKLGSLARLALSAAVQKRAHLRKTVGPASVLTRGFLLERAHLAAVPIGLEAVVRTLTGRGLAGGGAGLDLGRHIVQSLHDVLRQDGRAARLDAWVDGLAWPAGPEVGLTPWDATASPRQQARAAGALHAMAGQGTLVLQVAGRAGTDPEEAAGWLRTIWEQTEVCRVCLSP